ncbi:N-acetylglucosamine kinase [Wenxinia saemankumensis]|uniref:BadF-type ATPase n=1 Tax=Wenxinia saemankumensis TaxID=1447782 RepID=A0A1M6A2M3_9RHOB|nr:BadF/BadG/BcrA/BcrD ATPase family protein [Wenxinia saemankumensis]SHI30706.1 BadF-type ATPase [Wenxinia saemankumensis]
MTRALGVDVGGTAARWVLLDGDREVARGAAPGATGHPSAAARARLAESLRLIRGALPAAPDAAGFGITGAGIPPDPALTPILAELLGLPETALWIANDIVLAWHGAFPQGGPGHLISSGTGSVGVAITAKGPVVVGGRGTLIDDAGSGAWLALRALDLVLRDVDEGRAETPLHHAFAARIGSLERGAVTAAIYGGERGEVARLAPAVAEAAAAGDARARDLLTRAGEELARLVRALDACAGPAPVALIGGALALHPAIGAAFDAALPGHTITRPGIDAAATAARRALTLTQTRTP